MGEFTDLRVFVEVVDQDGFSAAANTLGMTPSAISKIIAKLEDRLKVRLLHRTTRKLALTAEGEMFHVRARDILAAHADLESEISKAGRQPHGRLRVSSVTAFALHQLVPKLPQFFELYPDIDFELTITDRVVDLLEDNMDVGIRTGPISDPSLMAKKITNVERGLFASPHYLKNRGIPYNRGELRDHSCIVMSFIPSSHKWLFHEDGQVKAHEIVRPTIVNSSEAALNLAIAGGGITRGVDILVGEAIQKGELKPVLAESHIAEHVPLSVVFPQGRHRMPKVRVFIDFLVENFKEAPWRKQMASVRD